MAGGSGVIGVYADEDKLLKAWVARWGMGGLPWGTQLVGDKWYGYWARLLCALEAAGWAPVMQVAEGLHQRVRASSRVRARAQAAKSPEVLRGRYRIEQVFGSVKGSIWN